MASCHVKGLLHNQADFSQAGSHTDHLHLACRGHHVPSDLTALSQKMADCPRAAVTEKVQVN